MKNTIMTTTLAACCTAILLAGSAAPGLAQTTAQQAAQQPAAARPKAEPVLAPVEIKVLRELHGVTLGMPRAQVNTALGKPMKTSAKMDEFKLDGGDMLTVRYDPLGKVRVVQFYCTDAKRAPVWADVIGDAPMQQKPNGSKYAQKIVPAENFWITMFQSQSGALTTITLSRQNN
jgi:hypothetical protein